MSVLTKVIAVVLLALAVALGIVAYRLAQAPAPAPVASVPAIEPAPVAQSVVQRDYEVVVASRDLAAGEVLQPDMLKVKQWSQRPDTAFTTTESLTGQALRFPVSKGEPLLQASLAQGLASYLGADYRALSIPVDEITSASRAIGPGDIVDVFFTLNRDRDQVRHTQARLLLSAVQVLAYGDQSIDGPLHIGEDGSRRSDSAARSVRTAVLAVPLNEVSDALLAMRNGTLQLALRSPKDTARPDAALFPERPPVLTARARLSDVQRVALGEASNQAYAGASLSGLAGAGSGDNEVSPAPSPSSAKQGHRLQLIRGNQIHAVPY